jgi:anti-sigma factor RsiW
MAKITRITAEQRESLVAYLDGELDDEAAQEIEQVLAENTVARHEVDILARTWDALGILPGARVSAEFTQQTLSSVHAAEGRRSGLGEFALARHVRRGIVLGVWAGSLALAAWAGFQVSNRWVPNESEQLLIDFELIDNFDKYTEVGDIEFLKVLKEKRTFSERDDERDRK